MMDPRKNLSISYAFFALTKYSIVSLLFFTFIQLALLIAVQNITADKRLLKDVYTSASAVFKGSKKKNANQL